MFKQMIDAHIQCFETLKTLEAVVVRTGSMLLRTLQNGGKILICGNGGSASDAQHFAAEIIGRFEKERRAFPAVALTTDSSILTAIANDYDYTQVFSRQVEGLGTRKDILVGISTSGRSANVIAAVIKARAVGMGTIGLLGKDGGELKALVDEAVVVPGATTARIQEGHIFILHYWAGQIENGLVQNREQMP